MLCNLAGAVENCIERVNWRTQTAGQKQLSLSEGREKKGRRHMLLSDPAMTPSGSGTKISCIRRTFSNSNKINDRKSHL